MSRIVSRNGLRYDNPGSTRGAEEHKKSGHMTAKNPVYNSIFKNGAKETRTPDPLHAMQVQEFARQQLQPDVSNIKGWHLATNLATGP